MKLIRYLIVISAILALALFEVEAQSGPYSAQIQRLLNSSNTWGASTTQTFGNVVVTGTCTNCGGGGFPLLAPDGTVSDPSYAFADEPKLGIYRAGASQLAVTDGFDNKLAQWDGNFGIFNVFGVTFSVSSIGTYKYNLYPTTQGTDSLALYDGTSGAANFAVYNTTSSSGANFERARIGWNANVLEIFTEEAGTGVARGMSFGTPNGTAFTITDVANVNVASTLTTTVLQMNRPADYGVILFDGTLFTLGTNGPLAGVFSNVTQLTPDAPSFMTGTTANAFHIYEFADWGYDFNNGPCGTSACTNPTLIIHSSDQATNEFLSFSVNTSGVSTIASWAAEIQLASSAGAHSYFNPSYWVSTPGILYLDAVGGVSTVYLSTNQNRNSRLGVAGGITPDSVFVSTGAVSNSFHIFEDGDYTFDFNNGPCGTSACTDPTLIVHSRNQATNQWIALYHDGVSGQLDLGTGSLDLDPNLNIDGIVTANTQILLTSGAYVEFTTGQTTINVPTTLTPDAPYIGLGSTSNSIHIAERADGAFDFTNGPCASAACTNPTLIIHSAAQATNQWLGISHDGTYAQFDVPTGNFYEWNYNGTVVMRLFNDGFLTNATYYAVSANGANVSAQWRNDADEGGIMVLRGGDASTGAAEEFLEQTAPAAGAANTARLYAEDNGAGKTRLCVLFSSGAAQCFATEP